MRCLAMSTVFTHGHLPRVPRARQSPLVTKISWRRPQSRRQHFLAPVAAADVCPPGRCSSAHSTNSTIRNPLSALSLSLLHQPPKPPCPWPSAFVRAVIGLYGAAFMGTSTPLVACCPPAWVANSRVARTWLLIWDLQQASPRKTVSDNF